MTVRSPVRGRGCNGCTLCCKLINVITVNKERGEWCVHCNPKSGCAIYETRPYECTTFLCGYLAQATLGEHWFPKKSRMVVIDRVDEIGANITVFVDVGSPNIWREEIYYRDIKHWARTLSPAKVQILVVVGDRVTLVLPDRDLPMGIVGPRQLVVTRARQTQQGVFYDAVVMEHDDPRVASITRS